MSKPIVTDAMVRTFVDSLPAVYAFDAPPPSAVRAGLEAAIALLARTEAGADGAVPVMYQQIHRHHRDAKWEECDKATFDQYVAYHHKYGGEPPVRALFTRPQDASGDAKWSTSDAVIEAWVERHDLGSVLRGADARCAFEDARTAHMIAATQQAEVTANG